MHDVAVVDASPLIFLGDLGRLGLLRLAARQVVVPEAVRREVYAFGSDDPAVASLRSATWIESAGPVRSYGFDRGARSRAWRVAGACSGERAAARPLPEELRRAGMYLSQDVIDRALGEVDE